MPGQRQPRQFSEKQKAALRKRQKPQISFFNPPGRLKADPARPGKGGRRPEGVSCALGDFLDSYAARLIELDHKYPIGHTQRYEWMEVHRRHGIKQLIQLFMGFKE
jgi:hypothetical protein